MIDEFALIQLLGVLGLMLIPLDLILRVLDFDVFLFLCEY